MTTPSSIVLGYHERTKHQLHAYARALGYMDWATQPEPFRRFDGAPQVELAEVAPASEPSLDAVLEGDVSPIAPLDYRGVSQLFYDSLSLSAWKEYRGTRWSLRVNPSSGNLHPTEGYLVSGSVPGLFARPGVRHYAPQLHALELRRELSEAQWEELAGSLPPGVVLVGLTSIHWRESWKYGERGFRYCHHDVGHAIGAVALAAAVLGWEARLLESVADEEVAVLLGVHEQDGIEAEHADCLLALYPRSACFDLDQQRQYVVPRATLGELRAAEPLGTPNRLSANHHEWRVIDEVALASRRSVLPPPAFWVPSESRAPVDFAPRCAPARPLIRQRRSAVALDGRTRVEKDVFLRMLASVRPGGVPFVSLPWRPRIHLVLLVHRVDGVEPGLYCMVRDATRRERLAAAMRKDLLWAEVDRTASALGLFLLVPLDCRQTARTVSCHQDIAADGAFALGMLADYEDSLSEHGPWFYRRLYWECGALGQVLYLEAEAAGMRSTGIGCFFDDAMHQMLGIEGPSFQTLYHFTVGVAVEDSRLRTAPAYEHLASRGDAGGG